MKFHVIYQQTSPNAQSPIRVVEQTTGREVGWINRYLDREYVRRLANTTLRIYAHNLLHFVRWWESLHHTGNIVEADLAESTLLDYVRFQSSQQPRPFPPPSMAASRSPIAPSATSSRKLLVRSRMGFSTLSCSVSRWALAAHGSPSAGCE